MKIDELANMADAYYETRNRRLALQKEVDKIEEEEKSLRKALIDHIDKSDAQGVSGKLCRVQVVTKPVPQVKDWEALWHYIVTRNQFDLVQRRVSDTAVKLRWADGKEVPGVEHFNVCELSVHKVGR